MPGVEFNFAEVTTLAEQHKSQLARVVERAVPLVVHYGQLLEARWKANAATGYHSPREPHIPGTGPGPNVVTGDFVRSIGPAQLYVDGAEIVVDVGSNAAQAARLEHGFVATDAAGRHYDQPPYPSAYPAQDWIAPQFEDAVIAFAGELLG